MSAVNIPKLLRVEEFERLTDPPGGRYELHHGEAVFVTFPLREHKFLQRRLRKLLERIAEPLEFTVDTEYPYRPLPQNEVWGADVACVSNARDRVEKWLVGSPELVIEVKSPSNKKHELNDKAMTTLAGEGAIEFWVVNPEDRSVTVYTKTTGIHVYWPGLPVPLSMFASRIYVADIFEGVDSLGD